MSATAKGHLNWNMTRDKDGHRTYKITWLVKVTSTLDGPEVVMGAAGLPVIGSSWIFGNDNDVWAKCWPTMSVKVVLTKEPGYYFVVEQTFTTKPLSRCQDDSIEDPLLEPDRLSGSFVKYTKEVGKDRNGVVIQSSSFERFRGSEVEFDDNRPTVTVEKNLATLPLSTFAPMIDTVNDAALWGLGARKIKLSNASWQRLLHGTCNFYYTVAYEFDIDDKEDGHDRKIEDIGTKVLMPGGDKTNPNDFQVYDEVKGSDTRIPLDGNGSARLDSTPVYVNVEYYPESNFLTLGIPTTL